MAAVQSPGAGQWNGGDGSPDCSGSRTAKLRPDGNGFGLQRSGVGRVERSIVDVVLDGQDQLTHVIAGLGEIALLHASHKVGDSLAHAIGLTLVQGTAIGQCVQLRIERGKSIFGLLRQRRQVGRSLAGEMRATAGLGPAEAGATLNPCFLHDGAGQCLAEGDVDYRQIPS